MEQKSYSAKAMFVLIKRTWKILRHFIFSEMVWSWPRQSDVLIFDASNQDLLLRFLEPWNPEILHVRGEQINMRVLMTSIFKSGSKTDAYVDCFVRKVSPRLVVTYIDNNVNFLTISQRHPDVKTLFIQNGVRSYYEDLFGALDKMGSSPLKGNLKVDYMLSFGCIIGSEYTRYISGTVVPVGSIKNNLVPKSQTMQKGIIAFISTWQELNLELCGKHYTEQTYLAPADRTIISNLLRYSKEKNKRLVIIPRNPKHSELRDQEEAHFRGLLKQEPEFLDQPEPYPSYQALDLADVVVGVDSTLAYESISRGNKTAIFTIRGELLGLRGFSYGWPGNFPDEGLFWTNKSSPLIFFRILDYLFSVDDVQWREQIDFSSVMVYDPDNSRLKEILIKELGSPSSR
jgi:surface carbohydrate biosynthesis protein